MDSAKRVMSGTHGELWYDGDRVGEVFKFQAKMTLNKEDVPMCGVMWTDNKVKSISGRGSMGLYKVSSRMANKIADAMARGQDPRGTLVSKLADPDSFGHERVVIRDVSFDDVTLADWEAAVLGKVECPFTFRGFNFMDRVVA